ncbi:hypothetical protein F52700_2827 [Fusarium sp. NRRL 52700]|nr:hypothetical protein F52700_2827 [Fusarium sp. NRRL 52700]
MSSQAAPNSLLSGEPPEKLPKDLQGTKVLFFTLDALFNRDYAIECALEKCRRLNSDLHSKSIGELKNAYSAAMAAAYQQHIRAQVQRPALEGTGPQAPVCKVGMIFRQLNLNMPSPAERQSIGEEFAHEFSQRRLEVYGASHCLRQLKRLDYSVVVVDHDFDWEVVKHLEFWRYIDAMVISKELLVRKPDPRVFQRAFVACGVSANKSVVVGRSLEDDIKGILDAGAEPILHMPAYNHSVMDFQGTRVHVVRNMSELLTVIERLPENNQQVPAQHHQAPPPVHLPIVDAPQNQEHPNNQNSGYSAQYLYQGPNQAQHPVPYPNMAGYERARPSWEINQFPPVLSEPSSGYSPRSPPPLPSIRLFPPTEDYGISIRNHVENRDHDGYGHGTSLDWLTTKGGYPPGVPIPHQISNSLDAGHRDQQHSRHDYGESGMVSTAQDQYQIGTASSYHAPHEPRERTMSEQIPPSIDVSGEHWRYTPTRRSVSMVEKDYLNSWGTGHARHRREKWEPPNQRR